MSTYVSGCPDKPRPLSRGVHTWDVTSPADAIPDLERLMRDVLRRVFDATLGEDWLKEGQNWLQHYMYLSAILPGPEEIYITSLSVGGQGTIRLSVQAKSGEILARLDKQLRAAGYEVKPQAITPGNDKHGYDFRSAVELIVPAKMKIDVSKIKPPARPSDDASLDSAKPTARLRKEINVATTGGAQ